MLPPNAQVFVVSLSGNEQACPPLSFHSCSTKPWKWGTRGMGSLICCLWYPFDGSASPVYMVFPLPRCQVGMLLPLLCTCHPSLCHYKNFIVLFLCCFGVSFFVVVLLYFTILHAYTWCSIFLEPLVVIYLTILLL